MRERMLIVDDGKMNREILKNLFYDKYEILEADNGENALNLMADLEGKIDVVLLDLIMPGLSGLEVLKECRQVDELQNIPIVVITSSENMKDQIEAFNLGANDFIAKPFVPEVVVTRVENVIASSKRVLSMKMEAQQFKMKAELDEMTGLYNKSTTETEMERLLVNSENHLEVMMVIDIDNFKSVNDTLGHQEGDHVIRIVSNLISSQFRKTDIVGRIGGDEFCVMMVDVPNMEIAIAKANEMIQLMKYKPGIPIPEYVTLSIGIATNENHNTSYKELFTRADEALYSAKHTGKAQYRQFGVEPVTLEIDEREIAILLSSNRSIRSIINASIPCYIRIIEMDSYHELMNLEEDLKQYISIVYVDVSEMGTKDESFWNQVAQIPWIDRKKIISICQEECTEQYLRALNFGVGDLYTAPIEQVAFKKRTLRYLEHLGIKEK